MKSREERMREFVNYHKNGDGECNGILLKAYADLHTMDYQKRYDLAYFYSVTYCIPSAIIMLMEKDEIIKSPQQWAKVNKKKIIFQSDRRYVRLNGNFERMLQDYTLNLTSADKFIKSTVYANKINIEIAINRISQWYFFGRFSAFLFIETLCLLMGYEAINTKISWKDGDTATSGLLNLFCLDKSADYFDKHDKLPPNITLETLDKMFLKTLKEIQKVGGEINVTEVETSLCAYRKFYKGSRYNGYYLDRQLGELNHYKKKDECKIIVSELFMLRKKLFSKKYLGELNNWNGVRKDCKTLYKRTGKVM